MIIWQIAWLLVAYAAGSVPCGVLVAKAFCGKDPRLQGSGNSGAANVSRVCGVPYGVLTLICDAAKGAIPVYIACGLAPGSYIFISLTGLACVFGHVCSCFMGFRGGKAVATSIGVFLPLAFWPLLGSSALCMLVIWRSGYISLGSLTLLGSLPFTLAIGGETCPYYLQWIPLAICLCVIVFFKHRDNIERLRKGQEKSWIKSRHDRQAKQDNSAQDLE